MKNKTLLVIIYAIVVVIMSVVAILLVENKDANFWISIGFALVAVTAVFMSALYLTKTKFKDFPAEVPFVSISTIYLTVAVAITLVLGVMVKLSPTWYFSIHLVILAGFTIISIFMIMGKQSIVNLRERTQAAMVDNKMLCADIDVIKRRVSDLPASTKDEVLVLVNGIYEKVKFSDPILHESIFKMDAKIKAKISELSAEVDALIASKCEDISNIKGITTATDRLIADRNNRIKVLK